MFTEQWIKENVCEVCEMVIANRWTNHRLYNECEKELEKKKQKQDLTKSAELIKQMKEGK